MATTDEGLIQVKQLPKQSNTLGAVGATLGGAALGGVVISGIGNAMSRYLGNIGANLNAISQAPGLAPVAVHSPTQVVAPTPVYSYAPVCNEGGFVSKEVAVLMSENAQLKAEKYADTVIRAETEPLKARVCMLEADAQVSKNNDMWLRNYVDNVFVHQPKVHFDHRTISTTDGCHPHHHPHHGTTQQ